MVHIRDYQIPWVGLKNGEHNFHFEIDESFFTYFDHAEIKRCDIHIDLKFQKSEHLFILKFENNLSYGFWVQGTKNLIF